MSILFSGDFHAGTANELSEITKKSLLRRYDQELFNTINYHIILGDGGFMWRGNHRTDLFNYKALDRRPFPILCVIGNHEPILGMKDLREADIGIGETVYKINDKPFVAYLKRGKVYVIDGIKFLVLGGALSVDKDDREPGKTWWEKEYWTEQEKRELFKLLETENDFDFVISHTGPHHINMRLFGALPHLKEKFFDEVALLNDEIHNRIEFCEWWCGHWHQNKYYLNEETNHGYRYLYKETRIVEKIENRFKIWTWNKDHGSIAEK